MSENWTLLGKTENIETQAREVQPGKDRKQSQYMKKCQ